MGKWTDKLYITHSEWSNKYGGTSFGGARKKPTSSEFRRLPFDCCALSLRPFEQPVCTKDGIIFDLTNITKHLEKEKTNPVTGESLKVEDLIKLNFFKNANGEYHCPITLRVFNENTHIVAVRTSGNVYAQEAIERLNIKPKHWFDLMTDEPFTRKDLITLQDPQHLDKRNLSTFKHLQQEKKSTSSDASKAENIKVSTLARKVLAELESKKEEKTEVKETTTTDTTTELDPVAKAYYASEYSTGRTAASLTSTALTPDTRGERLLKDKDQEMYQSIKKKGYVQLKTNYGDLNLELFCDQVPQTCHNFILLSASGYYNNITFHRLIRNFMVQGGDPTGTGRGGESFWKKDFPDQFQPNLSHNKRGILSMANRGPNTNGSQFFITFRQCTHLDNKHTVFGQLVGGMSVLDKIERVPTDDEDRPLEVIRILEAKVFVDPFKEYQERRERKLEKLREAQQQKGKPVKSDTTTWLGRPAKREDSSSGGGGGVAKYLKSGIASKTARDTAEPVLDTIDALEASTESKKRKRPITGTTFKDFSAW